LLASLSIRDSESGDLNSPSRLDDEKNDRLVNRFLACLLNGNGGGGGIDKNRLLSSN
jgi:hypothetical protein